MAIHRSSGTTSYGRNRRVARRGVAFCWPLPWRPAAAARQAAASKITVTTSRPAATRVRAVPRRGKAEFERANPGITVNLQPITATDSDYLTRLQLQMRSPRTSPTWCTRTPSRSTPHRGRYLAPGRPSMPGGLHQFSDTAKGAGRRWTARPKRRPDGTDTRGIWFNKEIFAKAGLPTDWQPRPGTTAQRGPYDQGKVPGVIPFNVYSARRSARRLHPGLEMLLLRHRRHSLTTPARKWVVAARGSSSLWQFVKTVFSEQLAPHRSTVLHPNGAVSRSGSVSSVPQSRDADVALEQQLRPTL